MSHLSLPVLPPSGLAPPPLGVVKVRYRALSCKRYVPPGSHLAQEK